MFKRKPCTSDYDTSYDTLLRVTNYVINYFMLKRAYNSAFKKFAQNHVCFDDLNKLSVNLSIKFLSFSRELVTELLTSIPPEIIYPSPPNPV